MMMVVAIVGVMTVAMMAVVMMAVAMMAAVMMVVAMMAAVMMAVATTAAVVMAVVATAQVMAVMEVVMGMAATSATRKPKIAKKVSTVWASATKRNVPNLSAIQS